MGGGHKASSEGARVCTYRDTCGKCGATRVDQQIGLEATPDEWAARLTEVFREARRVLADHGTLWIECGDSYAGGGGYSPESPSNVAGSKQSTNRGSKKGVPVPTGVKQKDLIGQPFLLAFALRADGWYWRGVNIWAKPNPLPESVRDRTTVAHSYVLQFAKRSRYFFDAEAVRESFQSDHGSGNGYKRPEQLSRGGRGSDKPFVLPPTEAELAQATIGDLPPEAPRGPDGRRVTTVKQGENSIQHRDGERWPNAGRNLRSVWTIPTAGFPEAHFATWPTKLVETILTAACPEQVCRVCGRPRERRVEVDRPPEQTERQKHLVQAQGAGSPTGVGGTNSTTFGSPPAPRITVGFTDCGHDSYRPGVVLDPFGGSGTTALVARKLGRSAVLIELNEDYCAMAARRLSQLSLLATHPDAEAVGR